MFTPLIDALTNCWQPVTTRTHVNLAARIPHEDGSPEHLDLEFIGHDTYCWWQGNETSSDLRVDDSDAGPAAVGSRLLRSLRGQEHGMPVRPSLVLEGAAALESLGVNGHVKVPAGGQVKVPGPSRLFKGSWVGFLLGFGLRACGGSRLG